MSRFVPRSKPQRPLRREAGRFLALGLGLGVAALVATGAELAYRRIETGRWELPSSVDMWVRDPDLLYRLDPGNPETPGSFRGGAPASPRSARYRIVCLGGSTTFGHGVAAEHAWPAALRRELRSLGLDVEVVNGGVPGYGSRQILLRYRREIAALGADVVILYMGWNRTGALIDPGGWVPAGVSRPSDGVLTAGWMALQHGALQRSLLLREAFSRFAAMEAEGPRGSWQADAFERVWLDDIRALYAEIQAHRQRPLVVIYPSILHSDMSESDRALYEPRLWREYHPGMVDDLARKHALLRTSAAERGVPVADLQGALAETTGGRRLALFLDNMHPSMQGNRWIAAQLAPPVAELLDGRAG